MKQKDIVTEQDAANDKIHKEITEIIQKDIDSAILSAETTENHEIQSMHTMAKLVLGAALHKINMVFISAHHDEMRKVINGYIDIIPTSNK